MMAEISELEIAAIHETGHIVMGMLAMGSMPRSVSILASGEGMTGGVRGFTSLESQTDVVQLRGDVLIFLAGFAAVDMLTGYEDDLGSTDDFETVADILTRLDAENDFDTFLHLTGKMLSYKPVRRAIRAGADYLLEHPQLEGDNVYPLLDLIHQTMGGRFRREHTRRVHSALNGETIGQCATCGQSYVMLRDDSLYCSRNCRYRAISGPLPEPIDCTVCGQTFQPRRASQTACSPKCRKKSLTLLPKPPKTTRVVTCAHCGIEFQTQSATAKHCSRKCTNRAYEHRLKEWRLANG